MLRRLLASCDSPAATDFCYNAASFVVVVIIIIVDVDDG